MAPRPAWKGYLKLSLVSCPVRVYSALARREKVAFNLLHKDTHNRIQMKPHDPEHYVAPDGAVAEEIFRVIQWAMREKQKAALSRFVLSNRERLIALMCRDKGLLMVTLRAADEVRDHKAFFADIKEEPPEPEMLELAERLIEQKSGAFDPSEFRDRYRDAVIEMAEAKVRGREPVLAKAPERGKVINLMDALKRSLEEAKPPAESRPRIAAGTKAEPVPGDARKKRKAADVWLSWIATSRS